MSSTVQQFYGIGGVNFDVHDHLADRMEEDPSKQDFYDTLRSISPVRRTKSSKKRIERRSFKPATIIARSQGVSRELRYDEISNGRVDLDSENKEQSTNENPFGGAAILKDQHQK